MTALPLWKLFHVLSVSLFAGSLLAILMVQSLLQRALDDADRKSLARSAGTIARLVVNPLAYAAFFSGLLYWFGLYGAGGSMKTMMSCTPVYVHVMLLFGFLALGMAQAWKGQARKLVAAIEANKPASETRAFVAKGWTFAFIAFGLIIATYGVAVLRVPNPPLTHCGAQ